MPQDPIGVLFVCMGNICRSPTAEALFRHEVERAGLEAHFHIDSAGTGAWHAGEQPDRRARQEAKSNGIDMSYIRARQVTDSDYADFHYVLAMDGDNLREMEMECPPEYRDRLHRFTKFAADWDVDDVPDPYYGGVDGFTHVFELCRAGAQGLLKHIRSEHGIG